MQSGHQQDLVSESISPLKSIKTFLPNIELTVSLNFSKPEHSIVPGISGEVIIKLPKIQIKFYRLVKLQLWTLEKIVYGKLMCQVNS